VPTQSVQRHGTWQKPRARATRSAVRLRVRGTRPTPGQACTGYGVGLHIRLANAAEAAPIATREHRQGWGRQLEAPPSSRRTGGARCGGRGIVMSTAIIRVMPAGCWACTSGGTLTRSAATGRPGTRSGTVGWQRSYVAGDAACSLGAVCAVGAAVGTRGHCSGALVVRAEMAHQYRLVETVEGACRAVQDLGVRTGGAPAVDGRGWKRGGPGRGGGGTAAGTDGFRLETQSLSFSSTTPPGDHQRGTSRAAELEVSSTMPHN
jgi:hypothetical protein